VDATLLAVRVKGSAKRAQEKRAHYPTTPQRTGLQDRNRVRQRGSPGESTLFQSMPEIKMPLNISVVFMTSAQTLGEGDSHFSPYNTFLIVSIRVQKLAGMVLV